MTRTSLLTLVLGLAIASPAQAGPARPGHGGFAHAPIQLGLGFGNPKGHPRPGLPPVRPGRSPEPHAAVSAPTRGGEVCRPR